MYLKKLKCQGFRSLHRLTIEPGPGLNVIRGANAQGKTTVLEALLYLATSRSHRTTVDRELVGHGDLGFRIEAEIERKDRTVKLYAAYWDKVKRFSINGVPVTKISEILGRINVVFFAPEDVSIVRGSASDRRLYIDMGLSQLDNAYVRALQSYRTVLRQRNELLRNDRPDPAQLDVWDAQLAEHARRVTAARAHYVDSLAPYAKEAYHTIAEDEQFGLKYAPDIATDADPLKVYQETRERDIRRGHTSRGPHRDDLQFRIEEEAARSFGSQGQQRSAALAMKLAEARLAQQRTGEYPILMLDDVLSELDDDRARRLMTALPKDQQCLLTTTEVSARDELFGEDAVYHHIEKGALVDG